MSTKRTYDIDNLPKIAAPYKRSKEDVWTALEEKMEHTSQVEPQSAIKIISLRLTLKRVASIAAMIAIVISVSAAVIYTVVTQTKKELQPKTEQTQQDKTIIIKDDMFIFKKASLKLTFAEIAKEYDVVIECRADEERLYSGRFKRDRSIEDVIKIVCRSMKLEYEQDSDGKYIIK